LSGPEARLGWRSSIATALGVVLSGPLALLVIARVAPQPPWQDAAVFVNHYHPVQALPYALGLLLVGGCVGMVVAASRRLARRAPVRAALATVAVTVFASLIALNYIVQTTFVPALVSDARTGADVVLAAVTMANPRSLGWSLEMWGYAVLGVATWLIAPALRDLPRGRVIATLLVANGVISLVGGVLAAVRLSFIASPSGFALFLLWNALMLVMSVLSALAWRHASI